MKQILLFTVFILIKTVSFGQNLFFIGEKSYSCTETFSLKSNSGFRGGKDLDVLIAKENNKALIVVSTDVMGDKLRIKGKIIIYLDDGSVITCIDRNKFDFINNVATTIYYLTSEELNKMKNSNINTIRFSLKGYSNQIWSSEEGDFSASNKKSDEPTIYGYSKKEKTDVSVLIRKLFSY